MAKPTFYFPGKKVYRTSFTFAQHKAIYPRNNPGEDYAMSGVPVCASAAGTVIRSEYGSGVNNGYGNFVMISHGDGWKTLYAHLAKRTASVGEEVKAGKKIGVAGATGAAEGAHLHFEIIKNNERKNPNDQLKKPYQPAPAQPEEPGEPGGYPPVNIIGIGIDLSHWNAGVNIGQAYDKGVRFAYLKITEGVSHVDNQASNYWQQCKDLGIYTSFYHYWVPGNGIEQAKHCMDWVNRITKEQTVDMPIALDCEYPRVNSQNKPETTQSIYDFARATQFFHGWDECTIYTRASWWDNCVKTKKYEWWRLPLWVAHWGSAGKPRLPEPWASDAVPFGIHQYGTMKIGGKDIDGNKWNGAYWYLPPEPDTTPEPPEPPEPEPLPGTINVNLGYVIMGGVRYYPEQSVLPFFRDDE